MNNPIIICAAVKTVDGVVICGARHFNCFNTMMELGLEPSHDFNDQGFIDQFNKFYTREEALKLHLENNPDWVKPTPPEHELFSEDLY